MKKSLLIIAAALAVGTLGLSAQGRKALRINEVMVVNDSSMVDDYGRRSAWIEIFNANFAPVEISSIYLTNDTAASQRKKYPVPLGDEKTRIGKRQHVVFFADGEPTRGTFHTNFVLTPGQDNWIGVYDANGVDLIDSVTIPAYVLANQTWARTTDGTGAWTLRTGGADDYITPAGANSIRDKNHKVDDFAERDANGFGMTIMAMCVVFSALLLLCLCFYAIGKINAHLSRRNKVRSHGGDAKSTATVKSTQQDSGEEIAAIVMALHEHLNAHDTESAVLTINKVKRAYSPWSSKIYSLREVPHHEHRKI